jgi:molybdate transport system substrate-binding protein
MRLTMMTLRSLPRLPAFIPQVLIVASALALGPLTAPGVGAQVTMGQATPAMASRAPVARDTFGIAVRAGTTTPDIPNDDALRRTLLAARAIAFTGDEQSGAALRAALASLGIARQVEPKLIDTGNGDPLQLVAEGRADLGVSSPDKIASARGVRALGSR